MSFDFILLPFHVSLLTSIIYDVKWPGDAGTQVARGRWHLAGQTLISVRPRNGFGLDFPGDFAKKLLEDVNHCLRGA